MQKRIKLVKYHYQLICFILEICLVFGSGFAYAETMDNIKFHIRTQRWASHADADWQISFVNQTDTFVSRLEYKDLKANLLAMEIDLLPIAPPFFYLYFSFATAAIKKGNSSDSDYVNSYMFSQSESAVDGRIDLWSLKGLFPILPDQLYGIIGFQHYKDSLRLFYGEYTLMKAQPEPFSGLDSHYDFTWDAVKIGSKSIWNIVTSPRLLFHSLKIEGELTPLLTRFKGEGIWNLRRDFSQDPSFKHTAYGYGVDTEVSLLYYPTVSFCLTLGWRYLSLKAKDGTSTTYFSQGEVGESNLDAVNLLRQGWFFKMALDF